MHGTRLFLARTASVEKQDNNAGSEQIRDPGNQEIPVVHEIPRIPGNHKDRERGGNAEKLDESLKKEPTIQADQHHASE